MPDSMVKKSVAIVVCHVQAAIYAQSGLHVTSHGPSHTWHTGTGEPTAEGTAQAIPRQWLMDIG